MNPAVIDLTGLTSYKMPAMLLDPAACRAARPDPPDVGRAGQLEEFYEPLVADGPRLERALADGTLVVDTRLRDALRGLGFGAGGGNGALAGGYGRLDTRGAAEYAAAQGYKTCAVLKDDQSDYTLFLAQYFQDRFTMDDIGGEVLAESSYASGDTDFSGQLTEFANLDPQPDFLFISSGPSETVASSSPPDHSPARGSMPTSPRSCTT